MYLVLFSTSLFIPVNIFFSLVNALCEGQHDDFQVIAALDNAMGIQRCSVYCCFQDAVQRHQHWIFVSLINSTYLLGLIIQNGVCTIRFCFAHQPPGFLDTIFTTFNSFPHFALYCIYHHWFSSGTLFFGCQLPYQPYWSFLGLVDQKDLVSHSSVASLVLLFFGPCTVRTSEHIFRINCAQHGYLSLSCSMQCLESSLTHPSPMLDQLLFR